MPVVAGHDETTLRLRLVALGRRLARRGLITAAEGNLSVRLGGRFFLVTPAGCAKDELEPADLLVVDEQGQCDHGRPTSEWPLHRAVYAARPDVGAICHAHAPYATAFAVAGRELDGNLLTETAVDLPRVPLAARAQPGTSELADAVEPLLVDHVAVLLANHGVLAVGADPDQACCRLEMVERLAQITWLATALEG